MFVVQKPPCKNIKIQRGLYYATTKFLSKFKNFDLCLNYLTQVTKYCAQFTHINGPVTTMIEYVKSVSNGCGRTS